LIRYEKDFRDVKPDFISVLIGINDAWRAFDSNDPTSAAAYEANYGNLLKRLKEDLPNAKIMIMEPFLLNSLPDRPSWRKDLDPKIHAARKLAAEYADIFLPLDGILAGYVASGHTGASISEDGVHPSDLGHGIIAHEWLKAAGVL
jgi:lysophospholipase L1-like esterase